MNTGGPDDISLPHRPVPQEILIAQERLSCAIKALHDVERDIGEWVRFPLAWAGATSTTIAIAAEKCRDARALLEEAWSYVTKNAGGSSEPGGER